MTSPKVTSNQFTERLGVCAVEKVLTEMCFVWRETRNTDVGIDGQVEFVDDQGFCTGHVIAAQVKSGVSYLSKQDDQYIYFKPNNKHKKYWTNFPLPVILFIHNPEENRTYWVDARRYLRNKYKKDDKYILVPISNELERGSRDKFMEVFGGFSESKISEELLMKEMAGRKYLFDQQNVNYAELFGLGLVDTGIKLFFSMSTLTRIVDFKTTSDTLTFGEEIYGFVDGYIAFLIEQNLIYYDLSDYLLDWVDREIAPILLAPLTPRGQNLATQLCSLRQDLFHERYLYIDLLNPPPNYPGIDEFLAGL